MSVHHVPDAGLVRVEAGEQAGPGRAAAGGVVELGEPQAAGGQRVEVRRGDLAAVAAEVARSPCRRQRMTTMLGRSAALAVPAVSNRRMANRCRIMAVLVSVRWHGEVR